MDTHSNAAQIGGSKPSLDFATCWFRTALDECRLNLTRPFDAESRERGGADSRVIQTVVGFDPFGVQITQERSRTIGIGLAGSLKLPSDVNMSVRVLRNWPFNVVQELKRQMKRSVIRSADGTAERRLIGAGCQFPARMMKSSPVMRVGQWKVARWRPRREIAEPTDRATRTES